MSSLEGERKLEAVIVTLYDVNASLLSKGDPESGEKTQEASLKDFQESRSVNI